MPILERLFLHSTVGDLPKRGVSGMGEVCWGALKGRGWSFRCRFLLLCSTVLHNGSKAFLRLLVVFVGIWRGFCFIGFYSRFDYVRQKRERYGGSSRSVLGGWWPFLQAVDKWIVLRFFSSQHSSYLFWLVLSCKGVFCYCVFFHSGSAAFRAFLGPLFDRLRKMGSWGFSAVPLAVAKIRPCIARSNFLCVETAMRGKREKSQTGFV